MAADEHSPVAHAKHGDLTLDQIAEMQPGMARLMMELSDRYWILYYAAQAENWQLARHELSELRKTNQIAAVVRPKYRDALAAFDTEFLKPVEEALRAKDWPKLDVAFRRSVEGINAAHEDTGHGYIEWQLPGDPPPYLRLGGRTSGK